MPAYMYPFLHDKSKVNQTSIIYYCSNSYHMLTIHISFSKKNYFLTNFYLKTKVYFLATQFLLNPVYKIHGVIAQGRSSHPSHKQTFALMALL